MLKGTISIKSLWDHKQEGVYMISLIMATYNGVKYLKEQLDSIKEQTMTPDEVLIFDDRSSDGTYEFIQNYILLNNLSNWSVFLNEKNKGYSLNFSDAMKVSRGDMIFLCDQDDIWHLDKIERMSEVMELHPNIQLLASNVHPFYDGDHPQKVDFEKFYGQLVKIERIGSWIKPARPGCSMCFRRDLLENYDDVWFENYAHDCLLWGKAVLNETAYIYNKDTIEFRRHDENASSRGGRSLDYRLKGLATEIDIISEMLLFAKKNKHYEKHVKFLDKQLAVYKRRKKILEKKSIIQAFFAFPYIRYYGRSRYWITDIFYCLK